MIVALGMLIALLAFVRAFVRRHDATYATEGYDGVRLTLARFLAPALELRLGADILWTAIAVIRTALNFFLGREMRDEIRRPTPRARTDRSVTS